MKIAVLGAGKGAALARKSHSIVLGVRDPGASKYRDPARHSLMMLVCGDSDEHEVRALALVWIRLAYQHGLGRDFAFGLLRR